jgi:hypothetical protein
VNKNHGEAGRQEKEKWINITLCMPRLWVEIEKGKYLKIQTDLTSTFILGKTAMSAHFGCVFGLLCLWFSPGLLPSASRNSFYFWRPDVTTTSVC